MQVHYLRATTLRTTATIVAAAVSIVVTGLGASAAKPSPDPEPETAASLAAQLEELKEAWEEAHPGESATDAVGGVTVEETADGLQVTTDAALEQELADGLEASNFPREVSTEGSSVVTTYDMGDLQIEVAETAPAQMDGGVHMQMSGGRNSIGVYVILTPMEQDLVISGAGFALGTAICAIPAVGWGLCTAIGAVITVAAVYLSYHGKCKAPRTRLKVYPFVPERNACVRP